MYCRGPPERYCWYSCDISGFLYCSKVSIFRKFPENSSSVQCKNREMLYVLIFQWVSRSMLMQFCWDHLQAFHIFLLFPNPFHSYAAKCDRKYPFSLCNAYKGKELLFQPHLQSVQHSPLHIHFGKTASVPLLESFALSFPRPYLTSIKANVH